MIEQRQFPEIAERLNKVRLARALALLSPLQRHLFRLIPVWLHCHESHLPGYNGPLTPCGVYQFSVEASHLTACDVLGFSPSMGNISLKPAFEGIYAMGSTASFGQNPKSDVDVWVVHGAALTEGELKLVRGKLDQLTLWFAQFDFEVNFYLVHPLQFCNGHETHIGCLQSIGHEHCGSAQHWLLLEEFYRSQIRLAGKTVAWWPKAVNQSNILNLGDVRELPASEYFGASLWQLYKGLEKPHKALLKVMLLEAYASDYPKTRVLSDRVWQKLLEGDFSAGNDPYFMLYEYIESYLLRIEDTRRLEIVRRCFYLKCGIKLTDENLGHDWRYHKLTQLVTQWGWNVELLSTLDNCDTWHCGQLQWFNEQLNDLMLASYQTLLSFASSQQLSDGLRIEELGVLTRKLHTYFNEDAHQLVKLNLLWSQSITETELTIIYSQNDALFHLYRQPAVKQSFVGEKAVYQSDNLASILAWACVNRIADRKTQWFELSQTRLKSKRLNLLSRRLLPFVSGGVQPVSKRDLCQPWHYRKLLFMLNVGADPTLNWRGQEMMVDIMNTSVFSLGREQSNMLATIDMVSLSSWGEWQCHRFEGEQGILQALSFLTPGLRRANESVQVEVISCSQRLRRQLEHAVGNLVRQASRLCHQVQSSNTLMQPLQIGTERYGIFFNMRGMAYQNLADAKSLYQQFSTGYLVELPRPELGDDPYSRAPEVIQSFAAKGIVQYFLCERDLGLDVFVLDDNNEISHFIQHDQNVDALVAKVSHHYAFDEPHSVRGRFNMPQFFLLERVNGKLRVVPFGLLQEDSHGEF